MGKVEKLASGLLAFSGFTSIYLGGPFMVLLLSSVVLYAGVAVVKKRRAS